jgi:hypothetical protein
MTQKQANRLVTLIEFLKTFERKKFNFEILREEKPSCGTIGCAIGWCPEVFPKLVEVRMDSYQDPQFRIRRKNWTQYTNFDDMARELFGLDSSAFCPDLAVRFGSGRHSYRTPKKEATPKQVAKWLTKVLSIYGYTIK